MKVPTTGKYLKNKSIISVSIIINLISLKIMYRYSRWLSFANLLRILIGTPHIKLLLHNQFSQNRYCNERSMTTPEVATEFSRTFDLVLIGTRIRLDDVLNGVETSRVVEEHFMSCLECHRNNQKIHNEIKKADLIQKNKYPPTSCVQLIIIVNKSNQIVE